MLQTILFIFLSLIGFLIPSSILFAGEPEGPGKKEIEGMGMVLIKGGCYDMGDTFGDGNADERPVHKVCVDDFYMAETELTQAKWEEIMENNPSYDKGPDNPVESVSWNDVQEFIKRLNQKTGKNFRLPTEAEWEYAARSGGKQEKYAGTSNGSELGEYAWYTGNSGGKPHHPVKQKKPNGLGLYDMSGNVWEWVSDWYGKDYYKSSPKDNPKGPSSGKYRLFRGGSWSYDPGFVRAAIRYWGGLDVRYNFVSFRLALSPSAR